MHVGVARQDVAPRRAEAHPALRRLNRLRGLGPPCLLLKDALAYDRLTAVELESWAVVQPRDSVGSRWTLAEAGCSHCAGHSTESVRVEVAAHA